MKRRILDSALRRMSKEGREKALDGLVRDASSRPNGEIADLDKKLCGFERRFGCTSEDMRRDVSAGTRAETWEICEWLMLMDLREQLEPKQAGSRS